MSAKNRFRKGFVLAALTATVMGGSSPAFAGHDKDRPQPAPAIFEAIPGVREFSGRMIVRPMQVQDMVDQGWALSAALKTYALAERRVAGLPILEYVPQTDEYIIQVPDHLTENDVSADLMATGAFQYAEPDWLVFPIACPNDPGLSNQWHHNANRMNSCAGWDLHTGTPTTSVGICDTGVLTTHEDLLLNRLQGYNAVDRLWESQGGQIGPVHPHGTQTTGCAAANGNNGKGVSGVGWNLSHRMLRVSNDSGGGSSLSVLQHAARTAVENGNKVASVSYSGVDSSSNLTTATYIKSIGGLLVWAAGNENRNLTLSNRDSDDILVIGATDQNDVKASFSNYGVMVDFVAPGVSIYTTTSTSNTAYAAVSGTSFACPLAAGLAALTFSANSSLTPSQVEAVIKASCDDLGAGGVDNTYGYGRIDVFNTLTNAGGGGGGITDCNGNGVDDAIDIGNGTSQDCNGNGVPDECDIANGTSQDANGNGIPDECDPAPGSGIWMNFYASTSVPGVGTVENEDIVRYDLGNGTWSLIFDGSDVGLSAFAIDGLAVLPGGDILLSFTVAGSIPGLGTVDDSDIVRFTPTSLGQNTSGTFSWYFDGSDVGLTTDSEDIDAISLDSQGRLIISTLGNCSMNGASGDDKDLFVFNATSLGQNTAGTFSQLFDASDVGLTTSNEDVDGTCWTPQGTILLSTLGSFSVPGLSGADEDVFQFTPTSLGQNTAGSYSMFLDLSTLGISTSANLGDFEMVP